MVLKARSLRGHSAHWAQRSRWSQPETHDKLTAAIQVATHAAILSFGVVLLELGYDIEKGLAIATPPHLTLLSLLNRVSNANPEVYWDIQHHHPDAASVRESLSSAVRALDSAARENSPREFQELFERIRKSVLQDNEHYHCDLLD